MRELLLRNFWLKVFSVMLATLLWFVLHANLKTDSKYPGGVREFQCRVTLLIASTDRNSYKIEPPDVTVKIHGNAATLGELDPGDIQAYINLAPLHDPEGPQRVEVIAPREVSLLSVSPAHVYVRPSI